MAAKYKEIAAQLMPMFPTLDMTVLTEVLTQVEGNQEKAIDILLSMSNVEPLRKPPPYSSPQKITASVVPSPKANPPQPALGVSPPVASLTAGLEELVRSRDAAIKAKEEALKAREDICRSRDEIVKSERARNEALQQQYEANVIQLSEVDLRAKTLQEQLEKSRQAHELEAEKLNRQLQRQAAIIEQLKGHVETRVEPEIAFEAMRGTIEQKLQGTLVAVHRLKFDPKKSWIDNCQTLVDTVSVLSLIPVDTSRFPAPSAPE